MLLSIIIASYNTRELLEQCLNSVIKSLTSANFKSNQEKILNQVQDEAALRHHPDTSGRHPDFSDRHPDENQDPPLALTPIPDQVRNDGFQARHPDSSDRHSDSSYRHSDESQNLPLVEIIVVDNNSQDNTVMWLKKYLKTSAKIRSKIGVDLSLIVNNDNLGFAKANNQGIKKSRGKYIMLLNSDTIIQGRALEKMVKFLEDNPEVGGLSPLLLNADGSTQIDYYMRFPNLWQIFFYHNRLLRPLVMKSPLAGLICFPAKKVPYPVDQLPGAAMMVRAKVWQKVGPLDEDYPFYFEDVDWSWRAKKMGQKLMVLPQAKIIHLGGGSWKKGEARPEKYYRQFFSSMAIFLKKNYPPLRKEIMLGAIKANLWLKSFIKKLVITLRGGFLINCYTLLVSLTHYFFFFP